MKLSVFKKVIREIIREELDYKFSRLRKELKEIVVKSNVTNVSKASTNTTQDTSLQNLMVTDSSRSNTNIPTNRNINAPKTNNKVLNQLLSETAQSDDWKTVEGKSEVQSVQDNTQQLPNHLAEALTKDYSTMLKAVEEKDNFKRGA